MAIKKTIPQSDLDQIVTLAGDDLRRLQGKSIFITGGTGYIGRWLMESLLYAKLDGRMTVLSRKDQPAVPGVTFIKGDVRDFEFPSDRFDFVIHAATDVLAVNSPLETFSVTAQGTQHVLDCARAVGAKRVLMLSSGAVYGAIDVSHVQEDYRGAPDVGKANSAYGIGKTVTEWLGNTFGSEHGIDCVSARVFAQIGPHLALDKHFAAGNFMRDAMAGGPVLVNGDGTPTRSYMYGVDLVVWLLAILVRGRHARAYNVGSDQSLSIRGLAEEIASVCGLSKDVVRVKETPKPGALPAPYVPDIMRAQTELGLKITVPLHDAISRTMDWYKK